MEYLAGLISTNYASDGLGKLSAHRPAAVIPFGSRYRFIDFPLSNMVNSGITQVGLITPHLYRSIMDHVGGGKDFGLSRKNGGLFILPGSTYGFDTGKGKISIKDLRGNLTFFERNDFDRLVISASNKIFNIDYRDVEKKHLEDEANVTLVYKKMSKNSIGDYVIDFDSKGFVRAIRKTTKVEKNVCVYLDTMIIDKKVALKFIEWYKDNAYFDIIDIINEALARINVTAYEFMGYAKSINNLIDYMEASKELLDDKVILDLFMNSDRPIYTKVHDAAPVKYTETSKVTHSMVGTGSIISGEITDSIIFRDCIVEKGAHIKNSVVMPKCHISADAVIENCICEKGIEVAEKEIHKGNATKPIILIK